MVIFKYNTGLYYKFTSNTRCTLAFHTVKIIYGYVNYVLTVMSVM